MIDLNEINMLTRHLQERLVQESFGVTERKLVFVSKIYGHILQQKNNAYILLCDHNDH